MTVDTPEPVPTRRQRLIALGISVSAFLLFYVVSSGPMAGLHRIVKFKPVQQAIEVAYAPLVWLTKAKIEPFTSVLKWYIELFR